MTDPTSSLDHPEFADFFDELPLWSAPFGLKILDRVPIRRGLQVLDVGCGTGFLSIELAQRCGPQARVWAIDPWPAAMTRLERKLTYHGIRNVELLRRDAADTGLADGIVDVAVSNLGINNFDDPAAVLSETRRLLRPGGRLLLTTNPSGHMAEVYAALREVLIGQPDRLAAVAAQEARRGSVEALTERLTRAGFVDVVHETSAFHLRFADAGSMLQHWLIRVSFAPAWESAAGKEAFAALEGRLNDRSQRQGGLSLTIPVALVEARRL